jgi:transposase-like protein
MQKTQIIGIEEALSKCQTLDDLLAKDGPIKKMLKGTIEQMLEAEMIQHLGYEKHSSVGDNNGNSRNGYKAKQLKTSEGAVEIKIPQDRESAFEPKVVKKYQTSSNEIEDKITLMYARGMTTRDIERSIEDMYGIDLSPTQVSEITNKVLPLVEEWQARPLNSMYPVLFLDAIHYKVRDGGKIITKAAYIILAIDENGKNDILGIWVSEAEGANFWAQILTDLQNRGVQDILIACVDGLKGFPEAIQSLFPKTKIQQCIVHQIRNSLRYIASKDQKAFLNDLKLVYQSVTKERAETELLNLGEKWGKKYQLVIKSWEANWENLSTYFEYPEMVRKLIYTTNRLEGFNRQLRKVTKNRSVFPNDESLRKLLWLATNDITRKWKSPIQNWGQIIQLLAIHFPDRISLKI